MNATLIEDLLGYRIAKAAIPAYGVFQRCIGEPLRIRRVDFTVLALLRSNDEVSLKGLCAELHTSAPHLSVVVERLVKRELVKRVPNTHDRRMQHLVLTSKGQALADESLAIARTMEADMLSHFTPAEKLMLFELLDKLNDVDA